MANEIQKHDHNLSKFLDTPKVTDRLSEKMGLDESKKFKAALASAVSTNPILLKDCEPWSVINAALIGHSLNLPPSPQLGYYYIVPYNNKKKKCKEGQFQIGYKGYIQLAMRSGSYRKLNVCAIKAGEFVSYNELTEEFKADFIKDPDERENAPTVGYCGYFEYINGFTKLIFKTKRQIEIYADKYSPAFSLEKDKLLKEGKIPQNELWKYSSFWYKEFDMMALKTLIRILLSKWGAMSVDMQRAYEEDLRADGVSFAQAQENADGSIDDDTGSQLIDAKFEGDGDQGKEEESETSENSDPDYSNIPEWTED